MRRLVAAACLLGAVSVSGAGAGSGSHVITGFSALGPPFPFPIVLRASESGQGPQALLAGGVSFAIDCVVVFAEGENHRVFIRGIDPPFDPFRYEILDVPGGTDLVAVDGAWEDGVGPCGTHPPARFEEVVGEFVVSAE